HFRPLGVCQYEAIHADLESQSHAFKNHNSQQTLKKASPKTFISKKSLPLWQYPRNRSWFPKGNALWRVSGQSPEPFPPLGECDRERGLQLPVILPKL
ncbi:hypothetical protein, partial [Novacetimonas maltaceti]